MLLPASFASAQTTCPLPFDAAGQIDLDTLAQAFADCTETAVWFEVRDQGSYDLLYSAPEGTEGRRITGIAHTGWSRDIPLEVGALFGMRAVGFTGETDTTIDVVVHFPDGPNGPRPPDVTSKPMSTGATQAALFLIGSEQFLIPGLWRIEVRHKGRIVAAQRFNLALPEPQ